MSDGRPVIDPRSNGDLLIIRTDRCGHSAGGLAPKEAEHAAPRDKKDAANTPRRYVTRDRMEWRLVLVLVISALARYVG